MYYRATANYRLLVTRSKLPHDATVCDTLAAAFAETGDFTRAVYWQTKAIEESKQDRDRAEFQKRLALFQNKQPYHDHGNNAGHSPAPSPPAPASGN